MTQKGVKIQFLTVSPPEGVERHVRYQNRVFWDGESIFEVSRPPRGLLRPQNTKIRSKLVNICAPIILESEKVGIFCLLTKLFTYISTITFVFNKKNVAL